jgi:hypothetical protein
MADDSKKTEDEAPLEQVEFDVNDADSEPAHRAICDAVNGLNGVREVQFVDGGVVATFNPIGITKEEICTAVRRSGYRATSFIPIPAGRPRLPAAQETRGKASLRRRWRIEDCGWRDRRSATVLLGGKKVSQGNVVRVTDVGDLPGFGFVLIEDKHDRLLLTLVLECDFDAGLVFVSKFGVGGPAAFVNLEIADLRVLRTEHRIKVDNSYFAFGGDGVLPDHVGKVLHEVTIHERPVFRLVERSHVPLLRFVKILNDRVGAEFRFRKATRGDGREKKEDEKSTGAFHDGESSFDSPD